MNPAISQIKQSGRVSLSPRFRVMRGKKIAFGPGKMKLLELVANGNFTTAVTNADTTAQQFFIL